MVLWTVLVASWAVWASGAASGAAGAGVATPPLDPDALLRERANGSSVGGGAGAFGSWLRSVGDIARWPPPALAAAPPPCAAALRSFQSALRRGEPWAERASDASGRYASQFFFGNDFWLGSRTLCAELNAAGVAEEPLAFTLATLLLRTPPAAAPAALPALPAPPPQPGVPPGARVVWLGVCAPAVCSPRGVHLALQAAAPLYSPVDDVTSPAVAVVAARRVPGDYSLAGDFKFHVLGGVTAALLLLVAAGTTFDLHRRRPHRPRRPSAASAAAPAAAAKAESGKTEEQAPGALARVLLSFSVHANAAKMLKRPVADEPLRSVHGLRVLSLAWVIMVHTYLNAFSMADNKALRAVTERGTAFQTVSNATFSVDTFFFISGLLMTFLYFRQSAARAAQHEEGAGAGAGAGVRAAAGRFLWLVFYRFARLTPAYLYVVGVAELTMRWLANVSVFTPRLADHMTCARFWWRNALYVNNLFPRSEMCMLWSWYMANDTQFYILGLAMLLLAPRHWWLLVLSWGVFLASSWVTTAFVAVHYEYVVRVQEPFALFDELYDKPWLRIGPYLIGMATGWLLQHTGCSIRIPQVAVGCGWVVAVGALAAVIYSPLHAAMGVIGSAAYAALAHSAWALALAWVVVACACGYGGYVNRLLSMGALAPLSRLTYCAYLVHPILMMAISYQMDGPLHLHTGIVLTIFLGNLVISYLVSFALSLTLEAPLVGILKIFMEPRKKSR